MNEPVFETYDYAIGGKLVVGKATMTDDFRMMLEDGNVEAKKRIKSELVHQMAEFMLENNLVEFTQYQNPIDFTKTIAVRAYLADGPTVKILRLARKIV